MLFKKVLISLGTAGALGGTGFGVYKSIKKTDEQKSSSEGIEGEDVKRPDKNAPSQTHTDDANSQIQPLSVSEPNSKNPNTKGAGNADVEREDVDSDNEIDPVPENPKKSIVKTPSNDKTILDTAPIAEREEAGQEQK